MTIALFFAGYVMVAVGLAVAFALITRDSFEASLMVAWPLALPAFLFVHFCEWLCER